MEEYSINYYERMLECYPEVIKAIREFQSLIMTESVELEEMNSKLVEILENAYISTADEDKIAQWEHFLGIVPILDDSTTLSERRDTILARLYNPQKLNTATISEVVKIFTGGSATSYFKDGTIYVTITPPRDNKQYRFETVEKELSKKMPAHLKLKVDRNYYTWLQTKNNYSTWANVKAAMPTWDAVLLSIPTDQN